MTANTPVRTATASELLKFRTPAAVYTARVNQASFSYPIDELTYDGGSGTYTDIQVGCLVYVGSSAGARDKGVARVRNTATNNTLYIEPISSIDFSDNDYLTVWNFGGMGVKFGLAVHVPATVYTARINQAFTEYDDINYLEYDGGSGTLSDVLEGMTCYIGSSAGARDKGIVRIRKAPTATRFYIGAVSDIQFADDDHLTIVDDFQMWGKEIIQSGETIYMDSEIEYSTRSAECVVRAAPMVAVIKLVAGTATFIPPSPALSECYDGATIASWQYTATGASATYNMTAGDGTAYWEYDTAGQYRWSLTVTDSNGRTQTTHRWVFVDPTSPDFEITSNPTGSFDDGGWSFGITMFDNASTSQIVDRAMVTLYTEAEYFGGVEAVIGKLAGFENIVVTGWIDGETIVRDSQAGTVSFSVYGAAHWMKKIRSSAIALENTSTTPTTWAQIEDMTADKALARILLHTSTAPAIMDCFFTGDETLIDILTQPSGSLFSQIEAAAVNTIFAAPVVNSLGQLYISIDPQMLNSTDRAALTTVMTITSADFETPIELERMTSGENAMVELQCNSYDGAVVTPVYSRAPGNIGKRFGEYSNPTNYYAVDQSECNRLAGCLLAITNPQYSPLDVSLAHQNRLIDIAPSQYCQISIAAGDTIRGITLTNQKLIPRRVVLEYNAGGYYKTQVSFEIASSPVDGITYYPPQPQDETVSDFDPLEFGGIGSFPSIETDFPPSMPSLNWGTPGNCKTSTNYLDAPKNTFVLAWSKSQILGSDSDRVASAYFPCSIRRADATNSTSVFVSGNFTNCIGALTLYGVAGGSRVITAAGGVTKAYQQGALFTFSPVAAVDVDGFELELDAGSGYEVGSLVASGTVQANDGTGVSVPTTIGNYYAVQNDGTAWNSGAGTAYGVQFISLSYEYIEDLSPTVNRRFYQALATSHNVTVADNIFVDNSGQSGYAVYNATSNERTANLGGATLKNVCAV